MRPSAVAPSVLVAALVGLVLPALPSGATPAAAAPAATHPIATDRPTVAASPHVVGEHVVQVEVGFQAARTGGDRESTLLTTPTLVRAGLSDRLEIRASSDLWTWLDTPGAAGTQTSSGLSPVDIGAKLTLRRATGGGPALGVLVDFGMPSGVRTFRREDPEWTARLLADVPLRPGLSLGLDAGARAESDAADEWYGVGLGAVVVSAALDEAVGGFLELAVEGPDPVSDDTGVVLDTGVTWRLSDELQVDAAIGVGLDDSVSPDVFGGLGVSLR